QAAPAVLGQEDRLPSLVLQAAQDGQRDLAQVHAPELFRGEGEEASGEAVPAVRLALVDPALVDELAHGAVRLGDLEADGAGNVRDPQTLGMAGEYAEHVQSDRCQRSAVGALGPAGSVAQ